MLSFYKSSVRPSVLNINPTRGKIAGKDDLRNGVH